MNVQIVELDKRTRVAGLWLLPGTKVEFETIGQANTFVYRNGGKIQKAKNVDRVDTNSDAGTGKPAGKRSSGKTKAEAGSE